MPRLVFGVTNFIGIRVEKLKFPPFIDVHNLRSKYKDLLPEISLMVRPYFYIATAQKTEAAYVRELEGIPDLFPLMAYPGKKPGGGTTIISMVGLYVSELAESGLEIEDACKIISQTLGDVGIGFDVKDMEILQSIPSVSIG